MAKRNLFAGKLIFLLLNFTAEFTLLSNTVYVERFELYVLLYSEFTLLSNSCRKPHLSAYCFTVFWIYTTLKRSSSSALQNGCFTVFWIYTTLKPQIWAEIDTQHYNCGKFISTTLLFHYNTFIFINNHYFLVFNLFADDIYCLYHDCHNN